MWLHIGVIQGFDTRGYKSAIYILQMSSIAIYPNVNYFFYLIEIYESNSIFTGNFIICVGTLSFKIILAAQIFSRFVDNSFQYSPVFFFF